MNQCLIFFYLIIEICCELNKTCINCLTKKINFKKIFIYFGIGILIILIIIILTIFILKYFNINPFLNISYNRKKTKEEILIIQKKIHCLFEQILKEENYIENNEKEKCIICLDELKINEKVCFLPCKHVFHFKCLKLYFYDNLCSVCPLCKYDLFQIIDKKKVNFNEIEINSQNDKEMIKQYKENNEIITPLSIIIRPNQNNKIINSQ